MKKCVLAYSGGLDTTVAIRWLTETYGYDVTCLTVDLGEIKDPSVIRERAEIAGAKNVRIIDAKDAFADGYLRPALFANALYEGAYPLATALGRPLMAALLVDVAREIGAEAVAHGCTGKGNDQVRFDVAVSALAPDLKVVAPVREWAWSREDEITWAQERGLLVPVTQESPYSVDANLWGRSAEGGILEDPWVEPPEDAYAWTTSPDRWPIEAEEITIGFEKGVPTSLDGTPEGLVPLITRVGELAGRHGVGRIDHIEDRLVGIKSREVYEAPAAEALILAHRAAEALTLPKDLRHHKRQIEEAFAQLVYDGLYMSPLMRALLAYLDASQETVTAEVRLHLGHGAARVVGSRAEAALYRRDLATYGAGDAFDATSAKGFIEIWGLPLRSAAQARESIHGR